MKVAYTINEKGEKVYTKPDYIAELKDLENLIAEIEDFEIPANEKKIDEANKAVTELLNELDQQLKELLAKKEVYQKFKDIADAYKEQKIEEESILRSDELISQDILKLQVIKFI